MTIISYEEFQKNIQEIVEAVGEEFKDPEQDWHPVLVVLDDEAGIKFIEFDPAFLDDKSVLYDRVEKEIVKSNAKLAAFICSAWIRTIPQEDIDEQAHAAKKPISDYDIIGEIVTLTTGDGDSIDSFAAHVIRSEDKGPTLEPWEQVGTGDNSFGYIPEALQRGLEKTHNKN